MLVNRAQDVPFDLRVDVIGGVLLIDARGPLAGPNVARLERHLLQAGGASRPVVLDLSRIELVDDAAVALLREAWDELGDRLRVVATPGSPPARVLKGARLRRFAIHDSLSGALSQASV